MKLEKFELGEAKSILWMNDQNLKDLNADGHIIGLHSYSHPYQIGDLPYEEQTVEYLKKFEHLLGIIGTPPQAVSHPCNSYSIETMTILRELGVRIGFLSGNHFVLNDPLLQPRIDHMSSLRGFRIN